jgi:hypothetical protein
MKQRLVVGVFLALILAIIFTIAIPVEAARPRQRPMPPRVVPCYVSVCTWTPIGSFCTVFEVPCSSSPGVVPGGRGDNGTTTR